MKLFQQLLLAPAALGLMTPMVASAAELNLAGVNKYTSQEQVTSISQFGDVQPTDWAYQALSNLIERYGCVAGYPDGTYKGGRAMTRFEAAALLNACLDRVTEVTDELKRLMAEFEKELAVLKGRVDGLEAKVGELEANQFSTTTKLKGQATFTLGGVGKAPVVFGEAFEGSFDTSITRINGKPGIFAAAFFFTGFSLNGSQLVDGVFTDDIESFGENTNAPKVGKYDIFIQDPNASGSSGLLVRGLKAGDQVTFNYDVRLNFDTSFTGKDLLRTQLRAGNAFNSAFGGGPSQLEVFADQCDGENSPNGCTDGVNINRLFYQFPIGEYFTATAGAKVRQDDMLAMWPSAYPADSVLDFFTYAGAPGAYSLNLGAGLGLSWAKKGWSISAVYVSDSLDAPNSDFGFFNGYTITGQLGYAKDNWGFAVAYTYGNNEDGGTGQLLGNGTSIANFLASFPGATTNSIGVSGYWSPLESRWVPSISAGFGYTKLDNTLGSLGGFDYDMWSWSVGFQWSDVFMKGNNLGVAIGMPTFVDDRQFTSPAMLEVWYKFQVTDNISITPAIFWIQNGGLGIDPFVAVYGGGIDGKAKPDDTIGVVLKTTFKF